jgi:hypothetical protein
MTRHFDPLRDEQPNIGTLSVRRKRPKAHIRASSGWRADASSRRIVKPRFSPEIFEHDVEVV